MATKPGWIKKDELPDSPGASPAAAPATSLQTATLSRSTLDPSSVTVNGIVALNFYLTPGANASGSCLVPGVAAAVPYVMPFRGQIIGLSVSGTANKSAGTLEFAGAKGGAEFTERLAVATGADTAVAQYSRSSYGFVRGNELSVMYESSSGYLPTTTVYLVTLWVVADQSEAA